MLNAQQTAILSALKNHATSYEITATKDGQKVLVSYSQRHSGTGLRLAVQRRADAIIKLTGANQMEFTGKGRAPVMVGGWTIGFSGRTRREAVIAGELPFIEDIQ